jgi:hypothetical protein
MRKHFIEEEALASKYHWPFLLIYPCGNDSAEKKIYEVVQFIVNVFVQINYPNPFAFKKGFEFIILWLLGKNNQWLLIPDTVSNVNVHFYGPANIS